MVGGRNNFNFPSVGYAAKTNEYPPGVNWVDI
jgi:hypothetical protein